MKQNTSPITLFAISFFMIGFFAGCGGQEEQQAVTGEDVKKEAKEAVETTLAYTEAKKEEYQKKLNAQLDRYEQRLDALQARAEAMTGEAKDALDDRLEMLRQEKEALQQKADELETQSGRAWDDLKAGLDEAVENLDAAFEQAVSRFGGSS
jgi:chromosome segregation ATPase